VVLLPDSIFFILKMVQVFLLVDRVAISVSRGKQRREIAPGGEKLL